MASKSILVAVLLGACCLTIGCSSEQLMQESRESSEQARRLDATLKPLARDVPVWREMVSTIDQHINEGRSLLDSIEPDEQNRAALEQARDAFERASRMTQQASEKGYEVDARVQEAVGQSAALTVQTERVAASAQELHSQLALVRVLGSLAGVNTGGPQIAPVSQQSSSGASSSEPGLLERYGPAVALTTLGAGGMMAFNYVRGRRKEDEDEKKAKGENIVFKTIDRMQQINELARQSPTQRAS